MKKFIIAALALTPSLAFAAGDLSNLTTLVTSVGRIVNLALPIVVSIALLAFFFGLVKLIWGGPEAVKEGKSLMLWGVVAIFVMVSIWGLVGFIRDSFGVASDTQGTAPSVKSSI